MSLATDASASARRALFAWGCGEDGQLGVDFPRAGTFASDACVETPRAVALERDGGDDEVFPLRSLAGGSRNSMCVTRGGETRAWGWNSHRTLALARAEVDAPRVSTPRRSVIGRGVDGGAVEAVEIASGGWHALCVDVAGDARGWGGNEYAQAGDGSDAADGQRGVEPTPDRDMAPARAMLWPPRRVTLPAPVAQVACGGMSSFALLRDGRVFEWGQTSEDDEPRVTPTYLSAREKHVVEIAAGSFHLLMRTRNGEVLAYGNGTYGQLGLGATGAAAAPRVVETLSRVGVVKIAAGGWHSAAVTAGGLLYTWGRGEYGRLGHGSDVKDKVVPALVDLGDDESNFIADVSLGGSHSCALTCDGVVLSWGRNTLGRLGRVVSDPSPTCGAPGRVVFPPLPDRRRWRVLRISCGGRHTLAEAIEDALVDPPIAP